MEQKAEQFKHLLEYFVSHLEYENNHDTSFVGYAQYIKPHIDSGDFQVCGKGGRNDGAFNNATIAKWRDFGDGHFVSFTLTANSASLHFEKNRWPSGEWSIHAKWKHEDDSDFWSNIGHVSGLFICYENKNTFVAKAEKEASLEELGLFDGKAANGELQQFWSYFAAKADDDSFRYSVLFNEVCDNLLWYNKNVILTGAPGTGKTALALDVADHYACDKDYVCEDFRIAKVRFHPFYDYTDFVEGMCPVSQANGKKRFVRQDGIFKTFCKTALAHPDKLFVFVIDEINCGDINKIFGETIYAIDPRYRGPVGCINTKYQHLVPEDDEFYKGFYVPTNVYIIGTMNDIDRSIESMDFSFRRLFAWREVDPRETLYMLKEENLNLSRLLEESLVLDDDRNHLIKPSAHVKFSYEISYEISYKTSLNLKQRKVNYEKRRKKEEMVAKLKEASFFATVTAYCNNLNRAIRNEASLGSKYQIGASYFRNTLRFIDWESDITEKQLEEALEL